MTSKSTGARFGEDDFFNAGLDIAPSELAEAQPESLTLDRVLLAVAFALGVAVAVVFGAALIYTLLAPTPTVGALTSGEVGRGVYLVSDGRFAKLEPRRGMDSEVVSESPKVRVVDSLVVVARHADDPSRYRLRRVWSGTPDIRRCRARVSKANGLVRITLEPGRLPAGLYELSLPRDSIFGGEECVFVSVVP